MKIHISNFICEFLGEISLEIYIIQRLVTDNFMNINVIHDSNRYYFLLSIIISIILAYITKQLCDIMLTKYQKMLM